MIFKSYLLEQNICSLEKKLFLFFGENIGLRDDFKKKIKSFNKDNEILIFNQEEILKNKNILYDEINNISLFEKKKIYFIDQASDKILELLEIIESRIDDQKIYLFSDILDKKSNLRNYFEKSKDCAAIACYADNEIGIRKIILNELKGFEGLSTYNINLIIDSCNLDRSKLKNELEKIKTYFKEKKIETNKLALLLNIKTNENFNLLKDEALKGNKIKTNKLLSDTILEPEKNIFYLNLINQRLNRLYEVTINTKEDLDANIGKLKPPIFWKDKDNFKHQAKRWNKNKINTLLNKTYNLEVEIKSKGSVNKNILIKKLIVDICELANVL
tara:strand:+ start:410 stop:1399 length:990 start_codon:yes stop_codon:yes gene_type:complete